MEEKLAEWMNFICKLPWKEGEVPGDWTKATFVPVYKEKGDKNEYDNYRGISLLCISGKVYGTFPNESAQNF